MTRKKWILLGMFILIWIGVLVLFGAGMGHAAPSVSSVSGAFSGNADDTTANIITINGSSFGTKTIAKPWIWATFESTTGPTGLGYSSTWDLMENAASTTTAYSGSNGLGSTAGWESDIFRIRKTTDTTAVGYGSQLFLNMKRRVTYGTADINMKWFRYWDTNGSGSDGTNYPNTYVGTQGPTASSRILFTELNGDLNLSVGSIYPHPGSDSGSWRGEQFLYQESASNNAYTGQFKIWTLSPSAGSVSGATTTWRSDTATSVGHPEQLSIEDDPSNDTQTGGVSYDDIYVDLTWARVYISDNATDRGASVTKSSMLIPITWSATQITAYFHQGAFANGNTAYIFVCDSTDSCSSGYQISVGGSQSDPTSTVRPAYPRKFKFR